MTTTRAITGTVEPKRPAYFNHAHGRPVIRQWMHEMREPDCRSVGNFYKALLFAPTMLFSSSLANVENRQVRTSGPEQYLPGKIPAKPELLTCLRTKNATAERRLTFRDDRVGAGNT